MSPTIINASLSERLLTAIRNRFHPLWRIRRCRWLHRIISSFDFPVWVKSESLEIVFRAMWFRDMPWLLKSLPKELEVNQLLEQLCCVYQPKVFWDLGANVGWFCWLVNARSGLTRAVLVEPLPLNAKLLRSTIWKNRLDHVRLVNAAVANRCGELAFIVDDKSGATSQLKEIYVTSGPEAIAQTYGLSHEIRVLVTTVDALIAAGEPLPDLVKIDVEEAEALVFQGAAALLRQGRTIFVFECHRVEAIDLLISYDYHVFCVDALNNFLAIPGRLTDSARTITQPLKRIVRDWSAATPHQEQ